MERRKERTMEREERKELRTEREKEREKDGKKEGKNDGKKDGKREGRKEGKKDVRKERRMERRKEREKEGEKEGKRRKEGRQRKKAYEKETEKNITNVLPYDNMPDQGDQGDQGDRKVLEYDDLFQHVSSFGRYQKVVFFSSCCLIMLTSVQFAAMLFIYGTPNFHCETSDNSTCPPNKCCDNCTTYVFDGPFNSIVSEIVASVCSVFADCISLLGLLRFLIGFGAGGNQTAHFTFILELLGPKYRSLASTLYQGYFASGFHVFNLFAYFMRDWRPLVLMSSLPGLLLLLFVRVYPESPRWLLSKNKLDEAQKILVKCGSATSEPLDRNQLRKAIEDINKAQFDTEKIKQEKIYTPLDLVRTPKLRKRTLVLAINWGTAVGTGYTIGRFGAIIAPYIGIL
ncbi:hypothetical protein QZH41_018678, partial [Actinostola sp. cb2023]